MKEEQLNTLREQDKNLRDAIRMEEAEMPQMPADLKEWRRRRCRRCLPT